MLLKLARELDEYAYYDHVPGSTAAGTLVGASNGVLAGTIAGATAGKATVAAKSILKANEIPLQKIVDEAGINGVNLNKVISKIPGRRKLLGIGATLGVAGGMLDGAYRGSMTGVGMNDRQYIKEEDIGVKDIVYNSRMAAMDMNSSRGRLSNVYNDNFGRAVGGLRRMKMGNQKNNEIMGDA